MSESRVLESSFVIQVRNDSKAQATDLIMCVLQDGDALSIMSREKKSYF